MWAYGLSIEHWINDGLMAVFFLFVGLELERELYNGELSDIRNALLPIFAAIGGIVVPASIHFMLNADTPTQAGVGIPMLPCSTYMRPSTTSLICGLILQNTKTKFGKNATPII